MDYNLLTRDECQKITQESEAFYCKTVHVEGQIVEVYDYRLASYSDFEDNKAHELRGLVFVLDRETYVWERNLLLHKFYNCNQTVGYEEEVLRKKKIVRIQNKEDGSIISFVKFKNGNIRAKSKTSFISEQAQAAQYIYCSSFQSNGILSDFIKGCLDIDIVPIFEYCSPENQIVLEYEKTELRLLQLRNNITGEYIPFNLIKIPESVARAQDFDIINLNDLLLLKKNSQAAIEGWVVTFEDGQKCKIKTDKYLQLHGLIGPDAFRENLLVPTILDGNIDDVIAALVPGLKKDKIISLDEKVVKDFNHRVQEYIDLRGLYFGKFQEDRKLFAKKHSKDPLFSWVMRTLKTSFRDVFQTAEVSAKEYILKRCKSLKLAKEYIERLST